MLQRELGPLSFNEEAGVMLGTRRRACAAVLLAAAVAACATERQAPSNPQEGAAETATKMLGTLEVRLSAPGRVRKGSPVTIAVDLVNRGDTAASLDAPGGDVPFDVVVLAARGDTVWRDPPADAARPGNLQLNPPVAPGGTQSYGKATWDQVDARGGSVGPGVYDVSVLIFAPAPWGITTVGPVQVHVDR